MTTKAVPQPSLEEGVNEQPQPTPLPAVRARTLGDLVGEENARGRGGVKFVEMPDGLESVGATSASNSMMLVAGTARSSRKGKSRELLSYHDMTEGEDEDGHEPGRCEDLLTGLIIGGLVVLFCAVVCSLWLAVIDVLDNNGPSTTTTTTTIPPDVTLGTPKQPILALLSQFVQKVKGVAE